MKTTVTISEIFGPVIQGEGPLIGVPTIFIRTGGCDYRCTWCDTPYAVLPEHASEWREMDPGDIVARLQELAPAPMLVTLSGGNPATQSALADVIRLGIQHGYTFACETQGSIIAEWFSMLDWLVLSPKPPSSGMHTPYPLVVESLAKARSLRDDRKAIKIVIATDEDLHYAGDMLRQHRLKNPRVRFYLQVCNPRGPDQIAETTALLRAYRKLAETVLAWGWHDVIVLPQLHALAWGGERGR